MSDDDLKSSKRRQTKKACLTEEQKKAHHIASEQKRRENIRSTFDKIVALTPSLNEHENRSELNILTKSADYIDALKQENDRLVALCRSRDIEVPSKLKYNGPGPEKMD